MSSRFGSHVRSVRVAWERPLHTAVAPWLNSVSLRTCIIRPTLLPLSGKANAMRVVGLMTWISSKLRASYRPGAGDRCAVGQQLVWVLADSVRVRGTLRTQPQRTGTHLDDFLCSAPAALHGHVKAPNHDPPATATALISPKETSARLCATNRCDRSPLQRRPSHPMSAAMARRVRLATRGHSNRPAPCEAKYSESPRPNKP